MEERELDRKIRGWLIGIAAGVCALVVVVSVGLAILISDAHARGLDSSRGAGGREARLEALVEDIEETVRDDDARSNEALRSLATEMRLWKAEIDEYNAILATMAANRGCPPPPPAPRREVESPSERIANPPPTGGS